ncbi:precorrin-3B synthase [Actinoplanes sp. L3-i22]|uniref:precorrin-3B synthase n=1 Tax=Actinoplanes sp. L3-i22 TaxID=2836373 RepID=UPI001C73F6A2|nr:precorrin-3B synthase [Actinoplanes sp. L3-i22]BCY14110.1 precorrin-3B synthase [Actinoplanes sp. L3-i22]
MTHLRQSDTDACPGALRLHTAADGLLARVRLPGGLLSGAQLRSLRELAEAFGDGRLELTSRANLQLRGLRQDRAETLASRLRAAGLLPSHTHDSVRNIAAPPLADARLRRWVGELDAAICADPELAALPGKFLFGIGQVPLAADVAAVPVALSGEFALRFGGHDTGLRVAAERVVEALVTAGHAFLAERSAQREPAPQPSAQPEPSPQRAPSAQREPAAQPEPSAQRGGSAWRLRELADGPARVSARVAAALGVTPVGVPAVAAVEVVEPGALVGVVTGNGHFAAGALVPLGRLEGVQAKVLEDAERLVVTPWRGVLVPDLAEGAAAAWTDRMAAAGLVVTATSRWSGVTACAGRPGCAKSLADVRADADRATRFGDGLPVHWVGCDRACGSPSGPHVRVEATAPGQEAASDAGQDMASDAGAGRGAANGAGYVVTRRAADGAVVGNGVLSGTDHALEELVAGARRA